MKNSIILLLLLFSIPALIKAQGNFPENGPLYIDTVVPRIDITIHPDTLDWIYENVDSEIEFHATFVFDNGTIRDTIDPVGFRLRGNTSRYSRKKSFKISFNTWTQGGKYHGVEKLNLNGEHNDPSIMRSKIGWDLLRNMNIPAPRANHVQVYINGNYYGLYINVEHVDEEFVKSRFNTNDGNLFKCLYPADLDYLGNDPDLYKLMSGDRRVYELGTNEEADDYTDLANFIDVLNNLTNQDLNCDLNTKFNDYDYLKIIAFDILTSNWDGYIYNKNNFYLYHNMITEKFEYIPYDIDNTFGIDWSGIDWGTRNIYSWQMTNNQSRPLYTNLMNNPEYRNQYTFYMKKLVYEDLDIDSLSQAILERRSMILPYVISDSYYPQDYGYTVTDFLNSYFQAIGAHVPYGIIPFIETRINSIKDQLENTDMVPVIKYVDYLRESSSKIWVSAYAEDDQDNLEVNAQYTIEGEEPTMIQMYDDGNHHDRLASDRIYGASIENIAETTSVSFQISALDLQDNTQLLPCDPIIVPPAGNDTPLLFINELMASNETTITDENGEFEDWLELYNAGDEIVWLGNKYLTDNLANSTKWLMPDYYMQPGEFVLFWADEDQEQGPNHTNFKLSKDGEEIGIFNESAVPIDQYIFGAQTVDISEGRFSDGQDNWIFFEEPTPGESNMFVDITEISPLNPLKIFPNPAVNEFVTLNKPANIIVYDMSGKKVFTGQNMNRLDIRNYNKGLYLIVTDDGRSTKMLVQ